MRFVAVGLLSVLCGLCLLSKPAIPDDAPANQPAAADAAKQIEKLQNEVKELQVKVQSCDCETLKKQISEVETLRKLALEQGVLIGELRQSLKVQEKAWEDRFVAELGTLRDQLKKKVYTEELPDIVLAQMQPGKKIHEQTFAIANQTFGVLKVVNCSGEARELFVDGIPYRIPSDGQPRQLKVVLNKVVQDANGNMKNDIAVVNTELSPFEGAKSRTLKRNPNGVFELDKPIEIKLFARGLP